VFLAGHLAGQHVANVKGVHRLDPCVSHGRHDGVMRQVPQGLLPMLLNRRLTDADDYYITHGLP